MVLKLVAIKFKLPISSLRKIQKAYWDDASSPMLSTRDENTALPVLNNKLKFL